MWVPLVLAGWGWLPQVLAPSESSWVFTLALAGALLWVGPLVQSVLVYPDGRLSSRVAWIAVGLAWFHGTVLRVLAAMFTLRRDALDIPENHLKVAGEHPAFDWVEPLSEAMPPVLSLLVLVGIGLRWRGWSPAQRVRFAPALGLGFLLFSIHLMIQLADDEELIADLFAAEQVVTALVAMAFLVEFATDLSGRLSTGRLVADAGASSADLGSALARALRDPTVEVTAETDAAAIASPGRRAVDLRLGDKQVGTMFVDDAVEHDPELLATARNLAALVLERERLAMEAEAHLVEVEASRARIVKAVDDERRRIERNLHDGAQQRFLGIALRLSRIRDQVADAEVAEALSGAVDESRAALDELRALARGLHPVVLAESGLQAAVDDLARSAPIPTSLTCTGLDERPIPPAVEAASYYVASEGLANVAKHSQATDANLRLAVVDGALVVEVADDGVGGADGAAGSGLVGLADRVAAAGGSLTVASPNGLGTIVTARFPLEAAHG
jgi:signal transduction histidine kinase